MVDFSSYSNKSKYYDSSKKLVIAIEEFVGLRPKTYLFLVKTYLFLVNNSEHKKINGENRNFVATSHNEYQDVLLNNKCIKHSMNRFKVKIIGQEHMKSTKLHYLFSMTKYMSKTIDMTD